LDKTGPFGGLEGGITGKVGGGLGGELDAVDLIDCAAVDGIGGIKGGCGLGDTARFDLGGDCGCGMGSAGLCRGGRDRPEEPAESDLAVRVTVADRDRGAGGSFRNVSSVEGISI